MARFERYITALAEDNFDDKTVEERLACYNERMNINEHGVDHLVENFVTGVQWILHYYYTGVPSWDWFYPYHYAPFVSDLKGFSSLQPMFELGRPFLAFEQMLACVPPTLAYHLPKPYQGLVTSKDSPITEFYPTKFEEVYITNGKWDDRKAWIHVVHLPFIDKDRLLKAMEPFNDELTDEEIKRNTQGSCLSYRYDHQKLSGHTYPSPCPSHFLDILNCKSCCTGLSSDPFPLKKEDMVFGLCEGVSMDMYFTQFPTLRHICHTVNDCSEDRCFTNRGYRCINILPQVETAHLKMQSLAKKLLGKTCYVRWPYMAEAKVSGLFNPDTKYVRYHDSSRSDRVQLQTAKWKLQGVVKNYWERQAIRISDSEQEVIVEVQELQGVQYGSKGYVEQWSRSYTYYPLRTIVMHRPEDAVQHHQDGLKSLSELFKKGDTCFVLKPESDLYGKQAEVSSVDTLNERVYVKVQVEPKIEAAVHTNREELRAQYYPIDVVASRLSIHGGILKKIIGSLFCEEGSPTNEYPSSRNNIGLKLQYYKKKLPGYTQWIKSNLLLSQAAENLINEYEKKFPSVFRYLREHQPKGYEHQPKGHIKYYESDLFPADTTSADDDDNDSGLGACLDWLESLPTREMELVDSFCEALEQSQIEEVQSKIKRIVQMEPVELFKPTVHQGGLIPDPDASYELLDRVVNVSKNCVVPFGLRGTVIGITKGEPDNSSVYEVLYDEEFTGGLSIRGSMRSAYYHPPSYLINLTHGTRMQQVTQQCQNVAQAESYHLPPHYNARYGSEERSRDHCDQRWRSERDEYRRYGERDRRGESDWRDRDQDRDRGRDYDRDRGYQPHDRDHYRERDSYRDSGSYRDQDRYRDRERESGYREKDRRDTETWRRSSVRNQYGGDRYPTQRNDRQDGRDWQSRQDSSVRRGKEDEGWERVNRRR